MSQQVRIEGNRVRAAVAAILGTAIVTAWSPQLRAAEAQKAEEKEESTVLQEVQVTGSRIVRKDMSSNSPLVTVDQQKIEDSPFISVEEALNDLPQFMAGGAGMTSAAVTSLQGANGVDGGRGTGDASNSTLLPDNAGIIGIVVPGAANVNLRGLGAGRSLTLINGHRGMPENAGMTVDLNTIPTIAMAGVEVITGGASAVYGADALAGVTNIRLRDNFEGVKLSVRSGINEVGDGGEIQVGGLMGAKIADGRGSALIGIEYSKRESTLWRKHPAFREVLESPYSSNGDYAFGLGFVLHVQLFRERRTVLPVPGRVGRQSADHCCGTVDIPQSHLRHDQLHHLRPATPSEEAGISTRMARSTPALRRPPRPMAWRLRMGHRTTSRVPTLPSRPPAPSPHQRSMPRLAR